MFEPASPGGFFTIFLSAAMVVVLGALYALLFALARLRAIPALMGLAHVAYAGLFAAAAALAQATHLFNSLFWTVTVTLLLAGYWLAPRLIWNLCVETNAPRSPDLGVGAHLRTD